MRSRVLTRGAVVRTELAITRGRARGDGEAVGLNRPSGKLPVANVAKGVNCSHVGLLIIGRTGEIRTRIRNGPVPPAVLAHGGPFLL